MSQPVAFVAMPFAPEFDDVYAKGIARACLLAGVRCERVDEQAFSGPILQRMCDAIAAANIVIADVTTGNANVLYELGHAHALGKRVILLTRNVDSTPFDIRSYPHVIYGHDLDALSATLAERIRRLLGQPSDVATPRNFPWPALLERATRLLADGKRKVAELARDGRIAELVPQMETVEKGHGAFGCAELQLSVIEDRTFVFHDWPPLRGAPALIKDVNDKIVSNEIFQHDEGAFAWIDDKSNHPGVPALRMSVALFTVVPPTPLRVVVEAHHEIA